MPFPRFIFDKTQPFTDSFEKDLKSKLDAVDKELAANGLSNSGAQIKAHQSEFLKALNELINKIANIVINDIKNKQLTKPEFGAIRANIEQLVEPLIDRFIVSFEDKIRRLIPKDESAKGVDLPRYFQTNLI